jgi:hypothetical protein
MTPPYLSHKFSQRTTIHDLPGGGGGGGGLGMYSHGNISAFHQAICTWLL